MDNSSPLREPNKRSGMGDYASESEPHQRYWHVVDKGRAFPPQKAVALPPELQVRTPDGKVLCTPEQLDMFKCIANVFARVLKEQLMCGTFFTQPPTWQQPPISSTAFPIDIFTPGVGRNVPVGGVDAQILAFTVPDRHVLVIKGFGNDLESPAAFADVTWRIRHGGTPYPGYEAFTAQLGDPVNPTQLMTPLIATHNELFEVIANNGGAVNHQTFVRFSGWLFPARELSQDGSWSTYHTP